jgi:iron-sulfur cluster assembly accessory protein
VSRALSRVEEAARGLGLSLEVRRFPQGTKTAADAARAVDCEVGQIVKSLVFVADGEPFLALTSGANRADVRKLAEVVGASEVRRASPEEARRATGFAIGGTPPFGHPTKLRVVVDRDLLVHRSCGRRRGRPTPCSRSGPMTCSGPRAVRRPNSRKRWQGDERRRVYFGGNSSRSPEIPMIQLTESAAGKVKQLLHEEGRSDIALRVAVQPGGCSGLRYAMYLDDEVSDKDVTEEQFGVRLVIDRMSVPYLQQAKIDFVDTLEAAGFTIDNPMAQSTCACGHSFH